MWFSVRYLGDNTTYVHEKVIRGRLKVSQRPLRLSSLPIVPETYIDFVFNKKNMPKVMVRKALGLKRTEVPKQ